MAVYDLDILGSLDSNGQVKELYDKEAIENSIIVWITSYNTDILRNPGRGGYLTSYLSKPMSDTVQALMREALIDGFNQDYNLVLQLKQLIITPDYENKTWNIFVEAYIPDIKDTVQASTTLNNLV